MAIEVILVNERDSVVLAAEKPFAPLDPAPPIEQTALVTVSPSFMHSIFKSATRTDAGTTTLATPDANGSLIISDILISGEKQAASSVTVQFSDGTNTENVFVASQVDVPAAFNHSFAGRMQGWKDARIDMITAGTADATVTIVYTKVPRGLDYSTWNSLR